METVRRNMMAKNDELEKAFELIWTGKPDLYHTGGGTVIDTNVSRALALLGKGVVRLDGTSSRLAVVNIVLTAVILLVGVVQIVLMLRAK
jgi:hypothetical protein